MKRAVIGVGSPFGEDGIGWRVIDQLRPLLEEKSIDLIKSDRPGVSLLEIMSDYRQVMLVDAVVPADETTDIVKLNQEALIEFSNGSLSSHAIGVAETVALGKTLGQLPDQLCCIGVSIVRSEEEKLQRAAEAVLSALKEASEDQIEKF